MSAFSNVRRVLCSSRTFTNKLSRGERGNGFKVGLRRRSGCGNSRQTQGSFRFVSKVVIYLNSSVRGAGATCPARAAVFRLTMASGTKRSC